MIVVMDPENIYGSGLNEMSREEFVEYCVRLLKNSGMPNYNESKWKDIEDIHFTKDYSFRHTCDEYAAMGSGRYRSPFTIDKIPFEKKSISTKSIAPFNPIQVRSMAFSNGLSDAQAERLAILAEEMAEVTQVIGKILRHGYESGAEYTNGRTNRDLLADELGDLRVAVRMVMRAGDISVGRMAAHATAKEESIQQYLHHQVKPEPKGK